MEIAVTVGVDIMGVFNFLASVNFVVWVEFTFYIEVINDDSHKYMVLV